MPPEDYDYSRLGMFGYPWEPLDTDMIGERAIARYDDET